MSLQPRQWQASEDGPDLLRGPSPLSFPEDYTFSTSWKRAQTETDHGGPVNDAERMVRLSDSDDYHRVLFALMGRTLVADCSCRGYQYHDWCAHVASLWWQWVRGRIDVTHLQTGREYRTPPAWLLLDVPGERDAYDALTAAELDAYLTCDCGGVGVREYARRSGRSPGTVGNLLGWAREKLGVEV
ncbi:SWIM zinc finger family protein [Halorientalis litorea]|uniref:SWIM zinc finger family protein n=1 Tax=Halorientalis litorea TaxID=2931977 RepID=UPI001FF10252|nr:SWIM zinc finger family protein [Halorientalis litorea]